jgi:tetratricopeptide (TPR) repeat protein
MKNILLATACLLTLSAPVHAKTLLDVQFTKCAEDINDGDPVAPVDTDGSLKKKVEESIAACTAFLDDPATPKEYEVVARVTSLNNRGLGYGQIGQFPLALRDFEQALRLDQNKASTYGHRAHVYKVMGETELYEADSKKQDELKAETPKKRRK